MNSLYRRICRWWCENTEHNWDRELLDDGSVRWFCRRNCSEPERFVEPSVIEDYGAAPDVPPRIR